jgi:hypothetical protein
MRAIADATGLLTAEKTVDPAALACAQEDPEIKMVPRRQVNNTYYYIDMIF